MPFQQIAQKIFPQSLLLQTWPLSGGISAEMIAMEIKTKDGQTKRLILRYYKDGRHDPYQEYELLNFAHTQGLPTPKPYLYDNSGQILDSPYLVMAYIEGEMTFTPTDISAQMQQMAGQLAQIHSLDISNHNLNFLPQSPNRCAELACSESAEIACSELVESVEALVKNTTTSQSNPPALLHGDYWPGNTLWRNGRLAAVIDWEDAELGDPLLDFAKSRSEIAWIFGIDALNTFTDHYQSQMAIDYADLPYWDLCAILRLYRLANDDFPGLAAFFAPYGRSDITAETIKNNIHTFTHQALERQSSK